jgi:restriction endonuclease S subunit
MNTIARDFIVKFREFERWDVTFFHQVAWHWPKQYILPLNEALIRNRAEVETVTDITDIPIIEKISFSGIVSITDSKDRKGYKGRLFWAETGDLIYSKIRVKQGSLAIVPPEIRRVAVSSEYPVYSIKADVADPYYIELVLRTQPFLRLLDGLAHGGSTKTRIPPEDFERLEIPLPPLITQRAIVARWQAMQAEIAAAKASLQKVRDDLNKMLFRYYHTSRKQDVLRGRWLVVNWKEVLPWDVKTTRAAAFRLANPTFRPLDEFAEEATELVKPWEEPEKEWPVYGVNNKEGVVFSHYQKGKDFNAAYKRIRKDWFFHNPTRSSVGSLGIVPDVPSDAITSPEYQVWRIKQDLIPGFVAALISTPFFIDLIQFHRVGAVKQRLYVDNLLNIRVPIFSQNEQLQIAFAREGALKQIAEAESKAKTAQKEIEALILGTRKLGEVAG